MENEGSSDGNGRYRDQSGRFISASFVPIRDYIERIFEEKDRLATSQRETLERALVEARETTEKAMNKAAESVEGRLVEAKFTVEGRLVEAKSAADAVQSGNVKRLENLESGGAPFASRLDSSLGTLKDDVDVLKANMVKTTVLDALREKQEEEASSQRRAIKNLYITVSVTLFIALLNMAARFFG